MDIKRLKQLHTEIDTILPGIVEIRHTLHQTPEIAMKEHKTAERVREALTSAGLCPLDPFLETDVVAILRGKEKGRNVTLRADIDALPIHEETGLPYASRRSGFMHACGHDGHTAMLIGAALVLSKFKDACKGSVRFVFQPGEEIVAAGKDLIEKGALKDPKPDAVIALHAWPGIPEGVIASKPGVFFAAGDFFKITVKGRGSHGARPADSIDPILTAARVVESLQAVVSRSVNALDPVVLSVCRISGGANSNTIPDSVEMEGTTRYFKPELRKKIPADMERIVKGVCDSMGATYDLSYRSPYIPMVNDSNMVDLGRRVAEKVFGSSGWIDLEEPTMGGEDFSYYTAEYPGAMFRVGMGKESAPLHTAQFDFNDHALKNGILFLATVALELFDSRNIQGSASENT